MLFLRARRPPERELLPESPLPITHPKEAFDFDFKNWRFYRLLDRGAIAPYLQERGDEIHRTAWSYVA
jgi:hypothetical protein